MRPLFLYIALLLSACTPTTKDTPPTVSIIIPMQHNAMQEIVAGFQESLQATYGAPLQFSIHNANNNLNRERQFIQSFRDHNDALVVPIGTSTTQLSLALIQDQPIISLGANFSDTERAQRHPCNLAIVHDEIPAEIVFAFIHAVYPRIKHVTLIHSANDTILPEVPVAIRAAEIQNIHLSPVLVKTAAELNQLIISKETDALFVLKDGLIVSHTALLSHKANALRIPLITSDQGSVENGAHFALGVPEKQIGAEGGKLAAAILKGHSPCTLPIVEMSNFTVFVNAHVVVRVPHLLEALMDAAASKGYRLEKFGS